MRILRLVLASAALVTGSACLSPGQGLLNDAGTSPSVRQADAGSANGGGSTLSAPGDLTLYVAPSGDDTSNGMAPTAGVAPIGPLRTLSAALAVVAKKRSDGSATANVNVVLRGGLYPVSAPVVIGAQHSGAAGTSLTIRRYPGERPLLSAGRGVSGWANTTPDRTPGIWVADYPDAGVDLSGFSHQLWINDAWATKARYPRNPNMYAHPEWQNQGFWLYTDRSNKTLPDGTVPQDGISRVPVGTADWNRIASWSYARNGEIYAYDDGGYTSWSSPIIGIGAGTRELQFANVYSNFLQNTGNRYFVANVFEQLTDPGEWFLDKVNRKIFLIPPAGVDLAKASVIVSAGREILRVEGSLASPARNVQLDGIGFAHTEARFSDGNAFLEDAAVRLENATGVVVQHCDFRSLAGSGVLAESSVNDLSVRSSAFRDLGNGAFAAYGHPAYGPPPGKLTFRGNLVVRTGLVRVSSPAVALFGASNSLVANNQIDLSVGIAVAQYAMPDDRIVTQNNVVSGNEVTRSVLGSADLGAIYIAGNSTDHSAVNMGSQIIGNRILHTVGAATRADGILLSPHGATGIYVDNQASGNLIQLNTVSDSSHSSLKLNAGSDNRFFQNLWANAQTAVDDQNSQVEAFSFFLAATDPKFFSGNQFYLNAVVNTGPWASAPIWVFPDFAGPGRSFSQVDGNLYWMQSLPQLESYPSFASSPGALQSLASWKTQNALDVNSGVARVNPGFQLAADGLTVYGNAAAGWSGQTGYGSSPSQLTGLRAEYGANACVMKAVGTQFQPVESLDAASLSDCLMQ